MTVEELNKIILTGKIDTLINKEEKRHAAAYSVVASKIATKGARVVLISGPSSSGKTTSSMRIGAELNKIGLHSLQISLDNYFVVREQTPKDEFGNYDFEALEAINIQKFNNEMLSLIGGKCVNLQKFDFKNGCPAPQGRCVEIDERTILIVEGLHALNPKLTSRLANADKFEIYLSALSPLQLNPTSDIRPRDNILLRRMIRDYKYRGRSAITTLEGWSAVRRGEQLHILPFEDEADLILDTSLAYEIAVLKPYVIPLLVAARDLPDAKR
ncbi:MAG: nucleoside kinase, partial [Mucinivorans sp.]